MEPHDAPVGRPLYGAYQFGNDAPETDSEQEEADPHAEDAFISYEVSEY